MLEEKGSYQVIVQEEGRNSAIHYGGGSGTQKESACAREALGATSTTVAETSSAQWAAPTSKVTRVRELICIVPFRGSYSEPKGISS